MLGPLGRQPFPEGEERVQAGTVRAGWFQHGSQGGPAARPDGSGQALALYQLSLVDAWRSNGMGLMGDAMLLSDRRTGPALSPTQLSWLVGAAMDRGGWRLEAAREDHRPLDRGGARYQAWRASAHAQWGSAAQGGTDPRLPAGLSMPRRQTGPALSGDWGLTWYFKNTSLPARSDLTGLQHLRYSWRAAFGAPRGPWRLLAALELPTEGARWGAAQLDASLGGALRWGPGELVLTRESRDRLDARGYHAWWQLALSWGFGPPDGANP